MSYNNSERVNHNVMHNVIFHAQDPYLMHVVTLRATFTQDTGSTSPLGARDRANYPVSVPRMSGLLASLPLSRTLSSVV
jgi:hypothetical protein